MMAVSTTQNAEIQIQASGVSTPQALKITVCKGQGSKKTCGGEAVFKALTAEAQRLNLSVVIEPAKCGCSGTCKNGPFLSMPHLGIFYHQVKEAHIPTILTETIQKGKILFPLLYLNPLQSIRADLIWEKTNSCIMAMDPTSCMVEIAEYLIKFHYAESCGKCFPCRLGVQKIADLIESIRRGKAPDDAIQELESLITLTTQAAYCAFAGKVSHIILAILSNFKKEFEIHIKEKRCSGGTCKDL
jgi:(2Fe-2S) ferredoxin